ncbi:TetR/AcrR family transcriptional regulator [Streptomyces sp. NPDC002851]
MSPESPESAPAPRNPGIGRGLKVRDAVLRSALDELAATGWTALTIEGVARRAGVHKTTVYRRWKDRATLVTEALAEHAAADIPIPDTGTVEGDLRTLAARLVAHLTSPAQQAVTAAVFSDAARLPEVADVRRRVFVDRFRRAEPITERAVARGELPTGTDHPLLMKSLIAPVYLRLLVTAEPLDADTAEHAAAITLAAARAGAFVREFEDRA